MNINDDRTRKKNRRRTRTKKSKWEIDTKGNRFEYNIVFEGVRTLVTTQKRRRRMHILGNIGRIIEAININ